MIRRSAIAGQQLAQPGLARVERQRLFERAARLGRPAEAHEGRAGETVRRRELRRGPAGGVEVLVGPPAVAALDAEAPPRDAEPRRRPAAGRRCRPSAEAPGARRPAPAPATAISWTRSGVEAVGQGAEQQVVGLPGSSFLLEHRGEVVLRRGQVRDRGAGPARRRRAPRPSSRPPCSSEPSLMNDPPVRVLEPADCGTRRRLAAADVAERLQAVDGLVGGRAAGGDLARRTCAVVPRRQHLGHARQGRALGAGRARQPEQAQDRGRHLPHPSLAPGRARARCPGPTARRSPRRDARGRPSRPPGRCVRGRPSRHRNPWSDTMSRAAPVSSASARYSPSRPSISRK